MREFTPELAATVILIIGDLANEKTHDFLQPLSNPILEKLVSIHELEQALLTFFETDRSHI